MANPTTISDIEARYRPLTTEEVITATALLDDAWSLLLSRRATLEADIDSGAVSTANAVRVVSAMVIRVLRNPEGLAEESVGEYRYRRGDRMAYDEMYVTADELSDLTLGGSRRFQSVRLVAHGEM